MVRMGSTVLVAVVTIFAVVEAARIRRESDDCDKITLAHGECVKEAYDTYVAEHGAGDDGRGDWEARKSCIYVNSAVGVCGDMLAGCYGEDEAVALKDHQVEAILKQLERSVGGWDSSKCPVVSEYLERQAGHDEEVAEEGDAEEGNAEEGDGEEGDAEEGDAEEDDAEEGDAEEGDAEEGDAEEGDAEEGDAEEGDAEEGDAEEGDAEEVDAEEGDDTEGDESEDGEEGDEDTEDDEDEEDAGEGDEEDDEESSSPILLSSLMVVLASLLAA